MYKPGGEARIGFRVTNSRGEGVQAALGVEIIDQAVFALAEKQPGFAKVFFYLEQEVLKPRYEIHSVTLSDAISSGDPANPVAVTARRRRCLPPHVAGDLQTLRSQFGAHSAGGQVSAVRLPLPRAAPH